MKTTTEIKIRGYHTDVFQHVNNARYLELLEEGRWDYFEKNNLFRLFKEGINHAVTNININYRKEAFVGDILTIETKVKESNGKFYIMSQKIYSKNSGVVIADAELTEVFIYANSRK